MAVDAAFAASGVETSDEEAMLMSELKRRPPKAGSAGCSRHFDSPAGAGSARVPVPARAAGGQATAGRLFGSTASGVETPDEGAGFMLELTLRPPKAGSAGRFQSSRVWPPGKREVSFVREGPSPGAQGRRRSRGGWPGMYRIVVVMQSFLVASRRHTNLGPSRWRSPRTRRCDL